MKSSLSPCGINCEICDAYIATKDNNQELFDKLAADYEKNMGLSISREELLCVGCTMPGKHISFCGQCEIRLCADHRGYDTCAECEDFPCEKGSFIWKEGSASLLELESLGKASKYSPEKI